MKLPKKYIEKIPKLWADLNDSTLNYLKKDRTKEGDNSLVKDLEDKISLGKGHAVAHSSFRKRALQELKQKKNILSDLKEFIKKNPA